MDKAQALNSFWNSFGMPAYDEYTVPQGATTPYITYNVMTDSLENVINLHASIWYKSMSWKDVSIKAEEIAAAIGIGGKVMKLNNGYLWINKGVPFAQRLNDTDDTMRRMYLNIQVEYLTAI